MSINDFQHRQSLIHNQINKMNQNLSFCLKNKDRISSSICKIINCFWKGRTLMTHDTKLTKSNCQYTFIKHVQYYNILWLILLSQISQISLQLRYKKSICVCPLSTFKTIGIFKFWYRQNINKIYSLHAFIQKQ